MATLDLTLDAHLQRMPTTNRTPRTHVERFAARFDYRYMGLAVLATETGTDVWEVTPFPGVQTVTADSNDEYSQDFIFYGGQTYLVTGGLAVALLAAGYSVLPAFTSGFSTGFEVV